MHAKRWLSTSSTAAELQAQTSSAAGSSSSSIPFRSSLFPEASQPSSSSASQASNNTSSPQAGKRPNRHNTASALSLLKSQPSHYIVASIYLRQFLLTARDVVTVPRLKDVKLGDVIRLDKIHEVGSRDYTVQASAGQVLGSDIVECKATVIEHTKGKMEETVKFKKRKGYKKTIKSKGLYTRLRIGDIIVGGGQQA